MCQNFKKEERWELRYVSIKDGQTKNCYPRSEQKKNEQLQVCKDKGIKVIHCKKLYPFSSEKNQHNFELIRNICINTMADMQNGDIAWDDKEFDRLSDLVDKANKYWSLPLPVAWMPYEDLKEAKELANMAIMHRQEACIAAGRFDLVTYCQVGRFKGKEIYQNDDSYYDR